MDVVFIANGGKLIGMGHIMRTLALAEEFIKQKFNVSYISKYTQGIEVITDRGYTVIPIIEYDDNLQNDLNYGSKDNLNKDILQIENIFVKIKPDIIIVDSYNVDSEFFHALSKYTNCLVYIDDLNMFNYPVNILINGTISAVNTDYEKGFDNELMLLGLKYNLIRSEFKNIPIRVVNRFVNNIMITVGGSDPYHMTEKLIHYVSQEDAFINRQFHVVVSGGFSNKIEVEKLAMKYENLIIYENPPKMSELMMISDLAITAGGSTIYEFAACGVPILAFCYAENQKPQMEAMEKRGLLKSLGNYNELHTEKFNDLYKDILENYEERANSVHLGQELVDCRGSERIVSEINCYLIDNVI